VGVIGSLCALITLYSLDFHLTLRAWGELLFASPAFITQVKDVAMSVILLGGCSVLLATGLGILGGMRALREAKGGARRVATARKAPVSDLAS
jgi:hypothetical protein